MAAKILGDLNTELTALGWEHMDIVEDGSFRLHAEWHYEHVTLALPDGVALQDAIRKGVTPKQTAERDLGERCYWHAQDDHDAEGSPYEYTGEHDLDALAAHIVNGADTAQDNDLHREAVVAWILHTIRTEGFSTRK